jgi:hypothetical protein
MGVEPMNTGFADLQGAFALACPRLVPIVYSTDYRFHFQRIQAHLNRHPLHFPLHGKRAHVRQMRSSGLCGNNTRESLHKFCIRILID